MKTRRCIMCDERTVHALHAEDRGLKGRTIGLCGRCFNDDDKLKHAVAFANAVWKRR